MVIPSRARANTSGRIVPSAASIEASASRVRPVPGPQSPTRPTLVSNRSTPHVHVRSASEHSLPPPPRKAVPIITTHSGSAARSRRLARPPLRPLQTTPVVLRGVSSNIRVARSPSPITPGTRSSSASPKTPAPNAEPTYLTSDDESKNKKLTLRSLFHRKRPDSLVSSSTLTSVVSGSGTSNASMAFNGSRTPRMPKAPSTFGGLPEEEDVPMMSTQTRHGIKRHAHPAAEVPYPISFEEMVLQG